MNDRKNIRLMMRRKRRQLSQQKQKIAALKIARILQRDKIFVRSKNIALYLANDGEISPHYILEIARRLKKNCYLPVVSGFPQAKMYFAKYEQGDRLQKNRFGIYEPRINRPRIAAKWVLNLVLVPLVAFDLLGNRLGMGAGFYDRAFAFKQKLPTRSPVLIGLAHHFQQVEKLPADSWDIPLDAIATDQSLFFVS